MSYKGNDLDLRPSQPVAGGVAAYAGASPISVDDVVLASCNAAYDAARFHASAEVRPEHLLHALTRVTGAAAMLAALGIGTDQLRRDTAVAIAAAMPAGPLEGAHAPAASAAFEDVLRRATELARVRHMPASVHDVLRTLLRGGPESPAAALLMQAAADPQQLARWRDDMVARVAFASAPAPSLPSDAVVALHARLDQLEAAIRALGAEAAADRKLIVESLQALRAAREYAPSALQIGGFDATLDSKLGEFGHTLSESFGQPLLERVESIESHLTGQNGGVAKALAITLSETVSNALSTRLDQSEAALKRLRDELARVSSATGERQIALEASIRAQLQSAEEASKTHERELTEIYEALVKLGTNQQTLGDNLSTWRIESGGDVGIVSNRLQQLEQTSLDLLTRLASDVTALRQTGGEDEPGRSNGFKRWLYGTNSVLGSGRRTTPAPERDGDKS